MSAKRISFLEVTTLMLRQYMAMATSSVFWFPVLWYVLGNNPS